MTAIETKNLTKKYSDITAVDGINFSIGQGELFSLLGVNGAGKTTTIKMLSCLIAPSCGDAFIFDKSIIKNPFAIKKIINVSPQETAVAPNLSVYENIEMIAGIYGMAKHVIPDKVAYIVDRFKLKEISKKKAKKLSGGMQRRLSIAMALITEPDVLFLDEPTLGLDVLARRELWSVIKELKGRITILLTTHYMEEAEALSDRVAIMHEGIIKVIGTVQELLQQTNTNRLEDAFVVINQGGM
ncbi:MAG: ATP-binding cassette domain-containing protein [Spirochaetales bacterium]|nr:ATP-binding cassette domain-containing protein [Spirochaetales bacterium]